MRTMKGLTTGSVLFLALATMARAQPRIDALSHASLPRSGRLDVFGRNFGSGATGSVVTMGGVVAIATTWTDTEIHAYVPEAAAVGPVAVQIEMIDGLSNAVTLDVAPPVTTGDGRVRWRFRLDSRFSGEFVTVAPDGTVYATDLFRLYALSPDGGLLWVAVNAGRRRPISLGPDGTIYTAGNLIKAINPDGTLKWEYRSPFGSELLAGPSVGPDGNIYAVQNTWSTGLGAFALDPDGELLFSDPDNLLMASNADSNSAIVFRPDMFYVGIRVSGSAQPVLNAFDFDGNQLWSGIHRDRDLHTQTFPKLDPSGRVIARWGQTAMQAINPDGSVDWIEFHPQGINLPLMPGIDAEGVIYTGPYSFLQMWAINPDGSTRWAIRGSSGLLDALNVPPDGSIILAGGTTGFGQPGWVRAYDTADGAFMWQVDLLPEQGFNQLVKSQQPTFTPDSRTAYVTTGSAENVSGFLYAIDTGPEGAVILPESFEVSRGVLMAGDLPDLFVSDDGYVRVSARRPTELAAASAEIEVTATATTDLPGVLEFTVEAASTGAPARQKIEMFNYDTGVWEVVDEREAPASDTVVTVSISQDAPRFVDPQTHEVKTRIGYVDLGITFPSWGGRFDQVFWTVFAN